MKRLALIALLLGITLFAYVQNKPTIKRRYYLIGYTGTYENGNSFSGCMSMWYEGSALTRKYLDSLVISYNKAKDGSITSIYEFPSKTDFNQFEK